MSLSSVPTERIQPWESPRGLRTASRPVSPSPELSHPTPPLHLPTFQTSGTQSADSSLGSSPTAGVCIAFICPAGPAHTDHLFQEICPYCLLCTGCSLGIVTRIFLPVLLPSCHTCDPVVPCDPRIHKSSLLIFTYPQFRKSCWMLGTHTQAPLHIACMCLA